jgi:hypothetical protein
MDGKSFAKGWRGAALIIVGIFMGATLITPAVAHVSSSLDHLWSAPNHIRDKGDARWVRKTSAGAGPVAYAHVSFDGTLDAANSKNVTGSSKYEIPGLIYYCVDVGVPFKTVSVSADASSPIIAVGTKGDPFTSCGGTGQVPGDATVQTFDAAGSATASRFYIVFN